MPTRFKAVRTIEDDDAGAERPACSDTRRTALGVALLLLSIPLLVFRGQAASERASDAAADAPRSSSSPSASPPPPPRLMWWHGTPSPTPPPPPPPSPYPPLPTRPPSEPPASPPPTTCDDSNKGAAWCAAKRSQGECAASEYVREHCRRGCGLCVASPPVLPSPPPPDDGCNDASIRTVVDLDVDAYHGSTALETLMMSSAAVATLCAAQRWQCEAHQSMCPLVGAGVDVPERACPPPDRGTPKSWWNFSRALAVWSRYWDLSRPLLVLKFASLVRRSPSTQPRLTRVLTDDSVAPHAHAQAPTSYRIFPPLLCCPCRSRTR